MGDKGKEIVFMKHVKNTNVSYGFTYDNEPIVMVNGVETEVSQSVKDYVIHLLNLEDWDREPTIREKFEMMLLIAEKIGVSKVVNAIKFFTVHNNSIEGKMELLMVESLPSLKEDLILKCDTIRDKYAVI